MTYDPLAPYGPLTETRVRVATWNVQGREGPWRDRRPVIADALAGAVPDLVALQESWVDDQGSQAADLGSLLGLHHVIPGGKDISPTASHGPAVEQTVPRREVPAPSSNAVLSRWPIVATHQAALPGRDDEPGSAFAAEIDGPRGPIALVSVITGSFRPGQSADRQDQVRALVAFVAGLPRRALKIVCGDFNAPPDSDEIRMLTGRAEVPVPGQVFYDAWEIAGEGPGLTWTSANPWAAPALLPDRRIDYVFTPWPRRGGQGHPVRAELLGTDPAGSDHYGVLAELRY